MKLAVIIPAAGSSQRYAKAASSELGVEFVRSKLDEDLGGRPVLQRTVELFANLAVEGVEVASIIVAGPHDPEAMAQFKARYGDKLGLMGCSICPGGRDHRYETVRSALAATPAGCTHVAVHDAARPCASPELVERVLTAALNHSAVIPGIDVADTIKRVNPEPIKDERPDPLAAILGDGPGGGGGGSAARGPLLRSVQSTLERANLVAVQTPQVFQRELLLRAYAQKDLSSTDDAQLIERLGELVVVVPGEGRNIKITYPSDLVLARAIMGARAPESRAQHKKF